MIRYSRKVHLLLYAIIVVFGSVMNTAVAEKSASGEKGDGKDDNKKSTLSTPENIRHKLIPDDEKLYYSVSFRGIPAGASVLRIKRGTRCNDTGTVMFKVLSKTNKFFSVFYKTEDVIRSHVHNRKYFALQFDKDLNERDYQRKESILFDYDAEKAFITRKTGEEYMKKEKVSVAIQKPCFDPLSALYYLRHFDLRKGRKICLPVCASKKIWEVVVHCVAEENIVLVKLGTFQAVKAKIDAKFEGIFIHKGEITVWLDKETGIVLYALVKIPIGQVVVSLDSVKNAPALETVSPERKNQK